MFPFILPFDDWLPAPRCGTATYPTRLRLRLRNTVGLPPAGLQPLKLIGWPGLGQGWAKMPALA